MKKCLNCILRICAVLLGVCVIAFMVLQYLGIDLPGLSEADSKVAKAHDKLHTRIKRNYTELKSVY